MIADEAAIKTYYAPDASATVQETIRSQYAAWESPLEKGTCEDCTDNDGDGWIDGDDADCADGEEEDGTYDDYSCSDGIDNDGNGFTDCADFSCSSTRTAFISMR